MADPRRSTLKRRNGTSTRKRDPIPKSQEEPIGIQEVPEAENMAEKIGTENQDRAERFEPDSVRLQFQEKLLRLQAEFDNYRKRQARDFRRLCEQGKKDLIQELLAVLDNYHRAEQLVEEGGHSVEEITDGLMKTSEQLVSILKQEGLKELEVAEGDPFDPNIHEAMLAESRDGLDQDTVLEIFQRGYSLGQDLLRPARVRVGKPLSSSVTGEQPETGGGE
ncbi:nucleotide exchange factor GrpE [Candidatus Fermentibacteria bacterium]|nr:MAG: nucleotide exchange factor GrpE [Candidatus Fermentibacteria bacterium]